MDGLCVLHNHHGNCTISGNGIERVKCEGLQSNCLYKGYPSNQSTSGQLQQIREQIHKNITSVSSVVANKIAGGNNQTATIIFVGKRGKGKSLSMGSILEAYASKIAVLLDGDPWNTADPSKYFTIDNVGIIDVKDILRVLRVMKDSKFMYNAFMLDDVGATLGARDYMTKKNKLLNLIFQTCRTKRVLTGMTIPDDKGLDKDPRENSDFFGIMEQSQFEYNMAIGKFFEQSKQYRSGAMHYVYLRQAGQPVIRHIFKSPSPKFINEYEPRRAKMADKLFDESMEKLDSLLVEFEDNAPKEEPAITVNPYIPKAKKLSMVQIAKEVYRDVLAGVYPNIKEGCEHRGLKYSTYQQYKWEGKLTL